MAYLVRCGRSTGATVVIVFDGGETHPTHNLIIIHARTRAHACTSRRIVFKEKHINTAKDELIP